MNPAVAMKEKVEAIIAKRTEARAAKTVSRPNVLVATIDPEIRSGLTDLFQGLSLNTIWLKGVEAAKSALARERFAACLCGFWLQDGTYRELIRHIRRERMDIPIVIVSGPVCPDEYRNFLAAINIGSIDFLSYPYRRSDLDRMPFMATETTRLKKRQKPSIGSGLYAGEAA